MIYSLDTEFYIRNRGWVPASSLREGDLIFGKGEGGDICNITISKATEFVKMSGISYLFTASNDVNSIGDKVWRRKLVSANTPVLLVQAGSMMTVSAKQAYRMIEDAWYDNQNGYWFPYVDSTTGSLQYASADYERCEVRREETLGVDIGVIDAFPLTRNNGGCIL